MACTAVGVGLAAGSGVGDGHAAPLDGLPPCIPVECVGALLGEPPAQLSAEVETEAARTGGAAIDVLVDRLDQHEAAVLTNGASAATPESAAGLSATYDDVRAVVLAYRSGEASSALITS